MYNTHDPRVLPMRHGVKPSCVVMPTQGTGTCLDYLRERLPAVSEAQWLERMARNEVLDELGRPVTPQTPLLKGLRLYYYREVEAEPVVPFEAQIVFQDEHIVVVDKPHFLPVTPGGRYLQNTVLVRLKQQLGLPDLSPVHRIDRDTAGLVLFSVRREDRGPYQAMFRDHQVHKTYEAIAPYRADIAFPRTHCSRMVESGDFIRMHEVQGVPNSISQMQLLAHHGGWGHYQLQPISGKRHQLRVHMAALGLGLRHDALYPHPQTVADGDFSQPLQLLAKQMAFVDPVTGSQREFRSARQLHSLQDIANTCA